MERVFYSLEEKKPKYGRESLEELLSKNKELTLIVDCDFKTDNITQKLEELKTKVNGRAKLEVIVNHEKEYIYDQDQITKLQVIDGYCKDSNYKMNVHLGDAYSEVENVIVARNQIEDFAEKLNSITINENGKQVPLSPIEKYFVVYKFVANRVYNASENFGDDRMRNWIGVLTSDKVICSGFASLLKCVCDRVFTKDELACYKQGLDVYFKDTKDLAGGHANNLVMIHDEKYGVHGLFTSDACWGSKKERNSMQGSFEYCLNPISVYGQHKQYFFEFPDDLFFYQSIDGVKTKDGRNCYHSSLLKDLSSQLGVSDIICKARYKLESEIQSELHKEIQAKNKQIHKEVLEKFNAFVKENNLTEFFELKIPSYFPESFLNAVPMLKTYEEMFSNISPDNLQDFLPKIKEFEEFYYKHKEDVFDKLESKAKSIGAYNNIFSPIYKICFQSCIEKKEVSYFIPYEQIQEMTKQEIDKARSEALQNGKDFLFTKDIPLSSVKNGLTAVATFAGLTDENQIQNFVSNELQKFNDLKAKTFEQSSEK